MFQDETIHCLFSPALVAKTTESGCIFRKMCQEYHIVNTTLDPVLASQKLVIKFLSY